MKVTLIILVFGFFLNLTSAFLWFNSVENEQPTQVTTTRTTRLTSLNTQQQNRSNNGVERFRQAVFRLNKNNSNRSPLQRIANQQQHPVQNTTASIKPNNSPIVPRNRFRALVYQQQSHPSLNNGNNRVFNQRSRTVIGNSFIRQMTPSVSSPKPNLADTKPNSSSIINNHNQSSQPRVEYSKAAAAANKQIHLLSALNTKTNDKKQNIGQNGRSLLAKAYYHEQLRDFYQHLYQQQVAYDQFNEKSALQRKNHQDGSKSIQSDFYSMILAHGVPLDNNQ